MATPLMAFLGPWAHHPPGCRRGAVARRCHGGVTVATARLVRDVFAPPTVCALHSPWPQPAGGACGEEVGWGAIGVICRRRLAFLAPAFSPLSILYHRGPPWRPRLPAEWDPRGGRPARGGGPGCQPSTHDRCRDALCAPTWRGGRGGVGEDAARRVPPPLSPPSLLPPPGLSAWLLGLCHGEAVAYRE